MYPSTGNQTQPKFAYIKFEKEASIDLGQHLNNTVFIDRALTCIPAPTSKLFRLFYNLILDKIPDEETALRAGPVLPGQRQLPPNVTNRTEKDADGQEVVNLATIL